MKEADVGLGQDPFNGSIVGEALLADDWIQYALCTLDCHGILKEHRRERFTAGSKER